MPQSIHPDALQALVTGEMGAPSSVLGRHRQGAGVSIRALRPWAKRVTLVNESTDERVSMKKCHDDGFFIAELDSTWADAPYHFESYTVDGGSETWSDPYIYPPLLSDYDIYLFSQGSHRDIYQKLGAHQREINGVAGINFAVWAPNCYKVALVGDFNRWDERSHVLENNSDSGSESSTTSNS